MKLCRYAAVIIIPLLLGLVFTATSTNAADCTHDNCLVSGLCAGSNTMCCVSKDKFDSAVKKVQSEEKDFYKENPCEEKNYGVCIRASGTTGGFCYQDPEIMRSYVYDQYGGLTNGKEISDELAEFSDTQGITVRLYVAKNPNHFLTLDEFTNFGREVYLSNKMDKEGDPRYNTLILYAGVAGSYRIGYFHSYDCDIFTRKMQSKESQFHGEAGGLSFSQIKQKVDDVISDIEATIELAGKECILHVCELIREGNDPRSELKKFKDSASGNPCPEMDVSNPKKEHVCSIGQESIKCLYEEAYRIEAMGDAGGIVKGKTVFMIDDNDWHSALSLLPIAVYHKDSSDFNVRKKDITFNPWIVYHREGDNVDFESIGIYLSELFSLKEDRPEGLLLVSDSGIPKKLKLALMDPLLGLGGLIPSIKQITPDDYHLLWKAKGNYGKIIISDPDDYKLGLLSAQYASLYNSPLLFINDKTPNFEEILGKYELAGKHILIIGNNEKDLKNVINFIKSKNPDQGYSTISDVESFQKVMVAEFNEGKVILVNPNDMNPEYCESFSFDTTFGRIKMPYCRDSINAPLLASVKNEIIAFSETEPAKYEAGLTGTDEVPQINEITPTDNVQEMCAGSGGRLFMLEAGKLKVYDMNKNKYLDDIILSDYSPDKRTGLIQSPERDFTYFYAEENKGNGEFEIKFQIIDSPAVSSVDESTNVQTPSDEETTSSPTQTLTTWYEEPFTTPGGRQAKRWTRIEIPKDLPDSASQNTLTTWYEEPFTTPGGRQAKRWTRIEVPADIVIASLDSSQNQQQSSETNKFSITFKGTETKGYGLSDDGTPVKGFEAISLDAFGGIWLLYADKNGVLYLERYGENKVAYSYITSFLGTEKQIGHHRNPMSTNIETESASFKLFNSKDEFFEELKKKDEDGYKEFMQDHGDDVPENKFIDMEIIHTEKIMNMIANFDSARPPASVMPKNPYKIELALEKAFYFGPIHLIFRPSNCKPGKKCYYVDYKYKFEDANRGGLLNVPSDNIVDKSDVHYYILKNSEDTKGITSLVYDEEAVPYAVFDNRFIESGKLGIPIRIAQVLYNKKFHDAYLELNKGGGMAAIASKLYLFAGQDDKGHAINSILLAPDNKVVFVINGNTILRTDRSIFNEGSVGMPLVIKKGNLFTLDGSELNFDEKVLEKITGVKALSKENIEDDLWEKGKETKENLKKFLEDNKDIGFLSEEPEGYLTIIASPKAIPLSKYFYSEYGFDYRIPLDSYYGTYKKAASSDVASWLKIPSLAGASNVDLQYDGGEDIAVGRIFGITNSDTSAYINRILSFRKNDGMNYFFVDRARRREDLGKLAPVNDMLFMTGDINKEHLYIYATASNMRKTGYNVLCYSGSKRNIESWGKDASDFINNRLSVLKKQAEEAKGNAETIIGGIKAIIQKKPEDLAESVLKDKFGDFLGFFKKNAEEVASKIAGKAGPEKEACSYTEIGSVDPDLISADLFFYADKFSSPEKLTYPIIHAADIPILPSTIGISTSAMNNDFYSAYKDRLFGINFLRRGGTFIGSVSPMASYKDFDFGKMGENLLNNVLGGQDLGHALMNAKKSRGGYGKVELLEKNFVLFGDPTLKPALLSAEDAGSQGSQSAGGMEGLTGRAYWMDGLFIGLISFNRVSESNIYTSGV